LGGGLVGLYETASNLSQLGPLALATGGTFAFFSAVGVNFLVWSKIALTDFK